MASEFKVIYCLKDYIVIYKPYGYLSEESEGGESCPAAIRAYLDSAGQAYDGVWTVHRLDRTTEGLMVYALNRRAAAEISAEITGGGFKKVYVAYITADSGLAEVGEMRDYLFFDRQRDKSFVVDGKRRGSKEAVLDYRILRRFEYEGEEVCEVRIELKTGRSHQIRVQFASRKSPLIGDRKYGSRVTYRGAALFSVELEFTFGGERVGYCCSPQGVEGFTEREAFILQGSYSA